MRSTEGLHITDEWRDQHFVYNSKVNTKVQQYDIKMFWFFFHAIPRRMYVLKKGVSSLIALNVKYF